MKHRLFLAFIPVLLLGFILRFYQLGNVPSSLDWDEVSWGYNAYSILHTGRDEYGASFPLSFRAFGDYKQPVYVYADVLPVAIFGLSPFSTRFPSAFFGFLTIPFVYLLVFELLKKEKHRKEIAFLSAGFFAIAPWSTHFSRVAFEANVGIFFLISGAYLLIKGFSLAKDYLLILGTLIISISAFTYHSQKIFTPLIFALIILFAWKTINYSKKKLLFMLVLFALINSIWVLDVRTTTRGRSVLFFPNEQLIKKSSQQLIEDRKNGNLLGLVIHNRRVVYAEKYVKNYISHFNPNWLFMKGDNPRHHAPGIGNLYLVDLPFILMGAFYYIKKKSKESLIVFGWLFLSPVASSLAIDAPNASRSLVFLPTWFIFSATGWVVAFHFLKSKKAGLLILVPAVLLVANFLYFLNQNFNHMDSAEKDWQYGYKQALEFTRNSKTKVFYSSNMDEMYSFFLFYNIYNPAVYQKSGGSNRIWQSCFSIDNSYFGSCLSLIKKGNLYISSKAELAEGIKLIKTITYSSGGPAVYIYEAI